MVLYYIIIFNTIKNYIIIEHDDLYLQSQSFQALWMNVGV